MDPVVVLDAAMSVAAAREAMRLANAQQMVAIRRRDPRTAGRTLWYSLSPEERDRVFGAGLDDRMPLGVSLDLHEHGADEVRELTADDVLDGRWTGLVVDGGRAVGWMQGRPDDRGPTRGIDFAPQGGHRAEPPGEEQAEQQAEPVAAYPRVDVPEKVGSGASFPVRVGLAAQVQPGMPAEQQAFVLARDTRRLDVLIKAENFTVGQVRHTLEVDPSDLAAHTVSIDVTAPAVTEPWQGRIEIEYAAAGMLIGTAWRELTVEPGAPAGAPASTQGGVVAVNLAPQPPIDLTVSISRGERAGTFLWSFVTPHPVPLPDEQVITELDGEIAETFALRVILAMHKANHDPNAESKVNGVAWDIANAAMPTQFWQVLAAVWRIAKDAGRLPSLLLVSQEALVPWELATTDADYIVDRTLVDPSAPQVLGAQVVVGRWRPAGPETPSGVRRPSTTPADAIAVAGLAVVVGEYGVASGLPQLPEAVAEGQALTTGYPPSAWVKGTASEMATLLKGEYTDRGVPLNAQVLHVAAHGEADPDRHGQGGVLLSDTAVRIDETIVLGSAFTRTAAPMVFLNCCQLASDSGGSLVEGGLATAFLRAGARAFIAPLWSVTDSVAKETALIFYQETLGKGRPVGAVMRELRARFSSFPGKDETTPLAYAYYGHPGLILTRQEAH
ncbi:MAG: CHAT domain-containing protein [Micropruina sp.]|uniref:CHAT domain-containing protein n=1 Tax=Micropruina sp. TaxID=2737536 RepID=UPI0039E45084